MPTPFPGMDPYLEQTHLWRQVHAALLVDIQRFLSRLVRPHYRVDIEQRTYLAVMPPQDTGIPDILILDNYYPQGNVVVATPQVVFKPLIADLPRPEKEEVIEKYLEIREVDSQEVVTVIEVLSPTNKFQGIGREKYLNKRNQVLASLTNLVEIDLLRAGPPMPMLVPPTQQKEYRLVVSRTYYRPKAEIYLFNVREPIPDIPIPLNHGDDEPTLPLNQLIQELYDQGSYDLKINYHNPPEPALNKKDKQWAEELINSKISRL
jgi:Protein of unknown function (DUF4058)